jgi:hypothetical protein
LTPQNRPSGGHNYASNCTNSWRAELTSAFIDVRGFVLELFLIQQHVRLVEPEVGGFGEGNPQEAPREGAATTRKTWGPAAPFGLGEATTERSCQHFSLVGCCPGRVQCPVAILAQLTIRVSASIRNWLSSIIPHVTLTMLQRHGTSGGRLELRGMKRHLQRLLI